MIIGLIINIHLYYDTEMAPIPHLISSPPLLLSLPPNINSVA
jgi:hypothetical protein